MRTRWAPKPPPPIEPYISPQDDPPQEESSVTNDESEDIEVTSETVASTYVSVALVGDIEVEVSETEAELSTEETSLDGTFRDLHI